MPRRPRSERSRWVKVCTLPRFSPDGGAAAHREHEKAHAVVVAFAAVGRVVRVEPAKFGDAIEFIARKS